MTFLLGGGPSPGLALGLEANKLLGGSTATTRLRIGCPFVSLAGIESLTAPISPASRWEAPVKHWLIGLHQGITEPAALRHVLGTTNSVTRIFTRGRKFDSQALSGVPIFHAKVIALEAGDGATKRLDSVLVSSANITRSAIGSDPLTSNFEAGAILKTFSRVEETKWKSWWQHAWNQCIPLTEVLIDRYEGLRSKFLEQNPASVELLDPPSLNLLASSTTMWMETGAMSGGSRNQIEFSRELASFFGPPTSVSRPITVMIGNRVWDDRPLTPKVTTFRVPIWRLSLPTATQGAPPYPGRIICFRYSEPSAAYRITVADPGSSAARLWKRESMRSGYVGRTSGDRAFGLF